MLKVSLEEARRANVLNLLATEKLLSDLIIYVMDIFSSTKKQYVDVKLLISTKFLAMLVTFRAH